MPRAKRNLPKQQSGHPRPEKRPPLTHFLCLPLVNPTSISQLEWSILAFKETHPTPSVADSTQGLGRASDNVPKPLIPEGAIRPLGTLHLTIGVMSLASQERFDEAVAFFQSLDLANLMHEAERVATAKQRKQKTKLSSLESSHLAVGLESQNHASGAESSTQPLTISLESLRALPHNKAATVLHASPVDPTGRLYPFCLMLRDKFLEAGFLVGESKSKKGEATKHEASTLSSSTLSSDEQSVPPPLAPEQSNHSEALDSYTAALTRIPKPRPFLLHTTIVNTIYVRGRHKPDHGTTAKSEKTKGPRRIEIDARELIARYQDYYLDEARTIPRLGATTSQLEQSGTLALSPAVASEGRVDGPSGKSTSTRPGPQFPFVWARNIPLDSVCICEMGAKNLDVDGDGVHPEIQDLHARLGAKYTIVTQRNLDFRMPSPTRDAEKKGCPDGGT